MHLLTLPRQPHAQFNRENLLKYLLAPILLLLPCLQAISIIAKTLRAFDDDGLIPAFGFGDGEVELRWDRTDRQRG